MSTFHNALFLGDVKERVRVLKESGQNALAYLTAATHGLADEAAALEAELRDAEAEVPAVPAPGKAILLLPPAPIMRDDNWPLLTVSKGFFESLAVKDAERAKSGAVAVAAVAVEDLDLSAAGGAWGDEDDLGLGGEDGEGEEVFGEPMGGGDEGGSDGGWELEDLDLPPEALAAAEPSLAGPGTGEMFVAPTPGVSAANRWATKCQLAADQAAAGAFDTAMRLLARQAGITEFGPMRPYFLDLYQASHAYLPMLPTLPSITFGLDRSWDPDAPSQEPAAPALAYTVAGLEENLARAYRLVTEGKFADSLKLFTSILLTIPLLVVDSRKEAEEVKELLNIARDYNIALRCEIKRREAKDNLARAAELAAYFTHCSLQRVHLALALRGAMTIFFKLKNFNTCATFCRRLLELNPDEKMAGQARQVLAACEKNPVDDVQLNYDPRNPFDLCSLTFTPIYRGNKFVEDPYTKARFQPECTGQICPVGEVSRIGAEASGLVNCVAQLR